MYYYSSEEVKHLNTRADRIKSLIEESGKSYQELERITGIKKSSLQRYATGVTTKIPLDAIEKLAKFFNVSQEYILCWDEKKDSPDERQLTEGEEALLSLFRRVPEDKQQLVLQMIRAAIGTKESS